MTKFLQESFSVNVGGPAYSTGWERIFGKKDCKEGECNICDTIRKEAVGAPEESRPWLQDVDIDLTDKSEIREQVEAFHRAMGLPVGDKPAIVPAERLRLRLNLVIEEFLELLEACSVKGFELQELEEALTYAIGHIRSKDVDMVEIADACADLDFVVEGLRLELGINGKPIAEEVYRTNMAKVGGPIRDDGKRLKPEGWTPPNIRAELLKQGWDESL